MKLQRFLLNCALLFLLASVASAGTVYVSIAADTTIGGVSYETEVEISNSSVDPQSFTYFFVRSFRDGTVGRPEGEPPSQEVSIPARRTQIFTNLVPEGATGLLELNLEPGLVATARLVPVRNGQRGKVSAVPVVSSRNMVDAGRTTHLQGLFKNSSQQTAVGLVNLSQDQNKCTVIFRKSDGNGLVGRIGLTLEPLSSSWYPDAFKSINQSSVPNARMSVTCGGPSYSYAMLLDPGNQAASLITPGELGDSALAPPGFCPTGALCFQQPGLFHIPSFSKEFWPMDYPTPNGGEFSIVTVSVTFKHNGWFSSKPDGLHGLFWLFNGGWDGTLGYITARGGNRNKVASMIRVGGGGPQELRADYALQAGQTYTVNFTIDTNTRSGQTQIRTATGEVVVNINHSVQLNKIRTGPSLTIWVGNPTEPCCAEVPSIGWEYSNLEIKLLP